MQVFCGHRETGELQLKKSSLKETGDVHLIKYSTFYCMPGAHDELLYMGTGPAWYIEQAIGQLKELAL